MKKLKYWSREKHLSFHFILFITFCLTANCFGQSVKNDDNDSQDCIITDYLQPSRHYSIPYIALPKIGEFASDQTLISDSPLRIHFGEKSISVKSEIYKLKGGLNLKIGSGELKSGSIFYFELNIKGAKIYYNIKKKCKIEMLGYRIDGKSWLKVFFNLKSKDCEIPFAIYVNKANIILEQYDEI
jgi:hypothetical protein